MARCLPFRATSSAPLWSRKLFRELESKETRHVRQLSAKRRNFSGILSLSPDQVSEVLIGQVLTSGQGQGPARQAAIKAGIPKEVPATCVNMMCGSGAREYVLVLCLEFGTHVLFFPHNYFILKFHHKAPIVLSIVCSLFQ